MTNDAVELGPATTDDGVDGEIIECLDPKSPKSFFLYAGAGSGKTRSLDTALKVFRENHGSSFRKTGQKVAVITYTNAACDEISSRVGNDPLFVISTIHSFCWSQIGSFHADIQAWLKNELPLEIEELKEKHTKGRAGTKAAQDRERNIASKIKRLEWLNVPRRFTYNPNGDNFGAASLNHSEVLKITANFIETKPSMQAVLVNRYPFLLIDESQDTNKHLMNAFFALEAENHGKFALGLFGDMMQRIYADGKLDLGSTIPDNWVKPVKKMNHRSPQRIVQLGNKLRASVDGQSQMAGDDSEQGIARLFIASADAPDKPSLENEARQQMAGITADPKWVNEGAAVKTLTLEHHMAASRMGFAELFASLDKAPKLTTGLRSGDLAGVRLFSERVAPLLKASARNDAFAIMALLRKTSPLLDRDFLKTAKDPEQPLAKVQQAVAELLKIDFSDPATTFMDVLKCVATHNLFAIPSSLKPFANQENFEIDEALADLEFGVEDEEDVTPVSLTAWRNFLETSFNQITPYADYVADIGAFGTHQGVKGLEFDRVLVVMDDTEARGFLFSYDKLLGATPLSESDMKKKEQGEEIGINRTQRLLYVTCTRAKKSLALIAYTNAPDQLEKAVIDQGWFDKSEIIRLNNPS